MRMWNVPPQLLCTQHILGEHKELHMFVGCLLKGMNLITSRYVTEGLIEIHNIKNRHDVLVEDFKRRGWTSGFDHRTPIDHGDFEPTVAGLIDIEGNLKELSNRCPICKSLINLQ